MNITGMDFVLVNVLSYFAGVFTGLRNYTDKDTNIMGNNWESIDWHNDPNPPSVEKYSKKTGTWKPIKTDFKFRFFKLETNDVENTIKLNPLLNIRDSYFKLKCPS